MKIVILDAKTLGSVPNISKISNFGNVISFETTSPQQSIEHIGEADIIITNKVIIDNDIMAHCPNIELICITATGMNNVDLVAAKKRNIQVKNAVGYSSQSVAQHTFAAIFQLYNQLNYYDHYVKSGEYSNSEIFTHFGPKVTELHNKTFGIIGLGNIGKTVAGIATAFGSNVQYYSTSGNNLNGEYPSKSFEELLVTSDIISIHAPLNEKTHNLIGDTQFLMMKNTAILVNVGRGGIVNELDLMNAIDKKEIAGACVDVFEKEPIDADNPLLKVKCQENLVLSPHNAWASVEARTALIEIVCKNIENYLNSKNQ